MQEAHNASGASSVSRVETRASEPDWWFLFLVQAMMVNSLVRLLAYASLYCSHILLSRNTGSVNASCVFVSFAERTPRKESTHVFSSAM